MRVAVAFLEAAALVAVAAAVPVLAERGELAGAAAGALLVVLLWLRFARSLRTLERGGRR